MNVSLILNAENKRADGTIQRWYKTEYNYEDDHIKN